MFNYSSPIKVNSYLPQNTFYKTQSKNSQSLERSNSQTQRLQQIQLNGYNLSYKEGGGGGGNNVSSGNNISSGQLKGTNSESPVRQSQQYQQSMINSQQLKLESIGIQKDQILSYHQSNGYYKKKHSQAVKRHLSSQLPQQLYNQQMKSLNPLSSDQQKVNQLRSSVGHSNSYIQQKLNGFKQKILQNNTLYYGSNPNVNTSLLSAQPHKIDIYTRSTYYSKPIQELAQFNKLNNAKVNLDQYNMNFLDEQNGYDDTLQLIYVEDLNNSQIDRNINRNLTLLEQTKYSQRNYQSLIKQEERRDSLSFSDKQQSINVSEKKIQEESPQQFYDFQEINRLQRVTLQQPVHSESSERLENDRYDDTIQINTPSNKRERRRSKNIQKNQNEIQSEKRPIKLIELSRISTPIKSIRINGQIQNSQQRQRSISQYPSFKVKNFQQDNNFKQIQSDREYSMQNKQMMITSYNMNNNYTTLTNFKTEKQFENQIEQQTKFDEKKRIISKSFSATRRNLPEKTVRQSHQNDIFNRTSNDTSMYQSQNGGQGYLKTKYNVLILSKKQKDEKIDQIIEKCTKKTYLDPSGDMRNELMQQKNNALIKINQDSKPYIPSEKQSPKSQNLITKVQLIQNEIKEGEQSKQQQTNSKLINKNDNQNQDNNSDSDSSKFLDVDSDEEDEPDNDETIDQMFTNTAYQPSSEISSQFQPPILLPNQYNKLLLLKSIYENRPSTVFFPYPPQCGSIIRNSSRTVVATDYEEKRFDLRFKVTTNSLNKCVGHAFQYAGIRETEYYDWNIIWGTGRDNKVKNMMKYQKVNHFPQCWNMGRKDCLWKNLSKVKRKFPQEYDFIPNTYILQHQSDWDRFLAKRDDAEKGKLWIMKPSNQAQGKNIKMISKKSRVHRKQEYIICEYVANPHLIDGLKYDLRIYVLVTSYDPLRIYIFDDGLTRFATEKYSTNTKELSKRYVHLTNYSLNKNNPKFQQNQDATADSIGSKWSLKALIRRYNEMGVNTTQVWDRIKDIVIKTCIAAEPYMTDQYVKCETHRTNCFELYGFDILIDDTLKPWLLEVNVRPSLSSSSPLDRKIKHTLICDTFNLIGLQPYDKKKYDDDQKKKIPGVPDQKRGFSKNIKDLSDLDENNCLQKLSPEDWNIIFETDEENYRTGHFERIFPPSKDKIDNYMKFFEYERYNNLIVRSWIKSSTNFLENILKKKYDFNV